MKNFKGGRDQGRGGERDGRDRGGSRGGGGFHAGKSFGGPRRDFQGGGDRGGFGGSRGGRDDRAPEMHKATCAECGKVCEVPFRPTGDRPVYCNDCFKRDDDRGGSDSFKKPFEKREYSSPRESFNNKPDRSDRPDRHLAEVKIEIESLHKKVDSLTRTIEKMSEIVRVDSRQDNIRDSMVKTGVLAPKKEASKKEAAKKESPKKAAAKKASPKKAAPKKASTKKATPKKAAKKTA